MGVKIDEQDCVFTNRMTKGGSERVISYLANGLCDHFSVDIVTMTSAPSDYELSEKVRHIPMETGRARNNHSLMVNYKRLWNLKQYIADNENATFISFVTFPSYILLWFRKRIKGKLIVTVRNDPKASHRHFYDKWFVTHLYPKADGMVFQTKEAQSYYGDIEVKNPVILPNPLNEKFDKLPYTHGGVLDDTRLSMLTG